MPRNRNSKKSAAKKALAATPLEAKVVGEVVMRPLSDVKPNDWNPNEMTDFEKKSLEHGLKTDGWLKSQSLLIWGTDEKKKEQNLIIDGEHRWAAGGNAGFKLAPMVFLHGLTRSQAKALTVKMDAKRGKFNTDDKNPRNLGSLLRSIQFELGVESLSIELGIADESLASLLAEPAITIGSNAPDAPARGAAPPPDMPSGKTAHVRMVQLFFDNHQHDEFAEATKKLASVYNTTTVTETVLEAIRRTVKLVKETQKSKKK